MKFSVIDGHRLEAQPGLTGACPVCGAITIAKCGEKNIWHWAHKGRRMCDHWWENETEWHRDWKNHFPVEWQESVHLAANGERHIADVKTNKNHVIEFQHSYIKPEERQSREDYYGNMVWVVDGIRRKTDLKNFVEALNFGSQVIPELGILSVDPSGNRLLKEWVSSRVPVFFDFGGNIRPASFWLLIPAEQKHEAFVVPARKEDFIGWYRKGEFHFEPLIELISAYQKNKQRKNRANALLNARHSRRSRF